MQMTVVQSGLYMTAIATAMIGMIGMHARTR
jgi:hypothetical protein